VLLLLLLFSLLLHEVYQENVEEILDNLVVDSVQNKLVSLEAKISPDDNLVSRKNKQSPS
jgi:hypothetical protein